MTDIIKQTYEPLNPDYTEIYKLAGLLASKAIPFEMLRLYDGYILCYPCYQNRIADVIEHRYSYGHSQNLLEEMGLMDSDDVIGRVTAETVCECWSKHWQTQEKER